jgi:hypothetical protein
MSTRKNPVKMPLCINGRSLEKYYSLVARRA